MEKKNSSLVLSSIIICLIITFISSAGQGKQILDKNFTGFYSYRNPQWKTGIIKIRLTKKLNLKWKKALWSTIKKQHDNGIYTHYIYELNFERKKYKIPPWKETQKMLDNFFSSTPEAPTYPELLFAIVPDEENITWGGQIKLQNKIHDYLNKQYKLKVYQWLSNPLEPRLDIKADGWIFDAYTIQHEAFFRHLQKFILYGKPVIPVLWAAEPGLDGFYKKDGIQGIFRDLSAKIRYCREFNLPVILFACSRKLGSVNIWMHSKQSPFPELRKFFFTQLKWLSSDESVPPLKHPVPIYNCSGNKQNLFLHKINFNQFNSVNHCLIDGVYNLRLSKRGLYFSGNNKKRAVLTWHFKPVSSFINSRATLFFTKKTKNSKVKFEYSFDQKKWHKAKVRNDKLTLNLPKSQGVYLRISLSGGNVLLHNMIFKAKHAPITIKTIMLKKQDEEWFFEEDFQTKKFIHYMTYKPIKQLRFIKGGIRLEGAQGYGVEWNAKQKCIVPEAISKVKLKVNCYADKYNWGGTVKIGVSLDGKNILKELEIAPSSTKQTRFQLKLNVKFPRAIKSFYIHLIMQNGSGVYKKNKSAAAIYRYQIIVTK